MLTNEITYSTTDVVAMDPVEIYATVPVDVTNKSQTSTVEGRKMEYTIVGDSLYAFVSAGEAPTWLTSLIDSAISAAIARGLADYYLLLQDVRNAIDSIDVAKNTYVTQIIVTELVDGIMTSKIDTLNATYGQVFATKVDVDVAIATLTMAQVTSISNLEASLTDSINAQITSVRTALATQTGSLASDISALDAAFADQESGLSAAASAVVGLQAYVGIDSTGVPNGTGLIGSMQSLSSFYVALENNVTGADGYVNTSLANLQVTSAAYTDRVESKFEYNSIIRLADNNYYRAGFGLNAVGTTGTGTELNPYNSEFWINAEKFKFTNSNQTGQVAPFTIDASGATPQITFNGAVSFSNVTGASDLVTSDEVTAAINNAPYASQSEIDAAINNAPYVMPSEVATAINTNTTTIDGSKITTGTLHANKITAGTLKVYNADISGDIQSNPFVAGSTGWKLYRSGDAEFNTATFRGAIYANDIRGDVNRIIPVDNVINTSLGGSKTLLASFSVPAPTNLSGHYPWFNLAIHVLTSDATGLGMTVGISGGGQYKEFYTGGYSQGNGGMSLSGCLPVKVSTASIISVYADSFYSGTVAKRISGVIGGLV